MRVWHRAQSGRMSWPALGIALPRLRCDRARPRARPPRCPTCGSPRLIAHEELFGLAIAHVDCDAFYASIEKRDDPEPARQAADHRRRHPRRGLDLLLHRPAVRRALGDADVHGAKALPGCRRHPARHGEIRRASAAQIRAHDGRADAAGRAAVDRRGVPRPHRHRRRCTRRSPAEVLARFAKRVEDRDRRHHLGRPQPQQVPRQDRLRPRQAARLCGDRQGRDAGVPRRQPVEPDLRRRQGVRRDAAQGRLRDHRPAAGRSRPRT